MTTLVGESDLVYQESDTLTVDDLIPGFRLLVRDALQV